MLFSFDTSLINTKIHLSLLCTINEGVECRWYNETTQYCGAMRRPIPIIMLTGDTSTKNHTVTKRRSPVLSDIKGNLECNLGIIQRNQTYLQMFNCPLIIFDTQLLMRFHFFFSQKHREKAKAEHFRQIIPPGANSTPKITSGTKLVDWKTNKKKSDR